MTYVGLRTDFKVKESNSKKSKKYKSRRRYRRKVQKNISQNGIRKECGYEGRTEITSPEKL